MTWTRELSEKIRRGEAIPLPLAALLQAGTPVTRLGMWYRLHRSPTKVNAHVVSVGNITAGGTGKTPAVIERASKELAKGKKVAVLTRGYGTPSDVPLVISDDLDPDDYYKKLGDEPALILNKLPQVIVFKGANRVASAQCAVNEYGCDLLLLDDGFQYTFLHRDENIVLIDAANPFGNGHLIPRGILREPLTHLSRATEIVLTRCDQQTDLETTVAVIKRHTDNVPLRKTAHAPTNLIRASDGSRGSLDLLRETEITALCGIGNPDAFFATLEALGATINKRVVFADHSTVSPENIPKEGMVVATEKDGVRLTSAPDNLYLLAIELQNYTN